MTLSIYVYIEPWANPESLIIIGGFSYLLTKSDQFGDSVMLAPESQMTSICRVARLVAWSLHLKAQHVHMYYNLLNCLMLSLSPSVVSISGWIHWGWTIVQSAGATFISPSSGCSSLSSSLHQIPSIVSDTVSNLLACHGNILHHLSLHPLADIRRTSPIQFLLAKMERVAWM
jgi:hypothetical protein